MFILCIAFVLIFIMLLYLDTKKPKNFPPGPKWYPIIGSALAVHRERSRLHMLCKAFNNLSDKYPNNGALGFKVGKDKVVIVLSPDILKEMFMNEQMNGRPTGPFFETRTWGMKRGVLLTDGDLWVNQKRFVYRHLKDFGFGRSGMFHIIEKESTCLIADFRNLIDVNGNGKSMIMEMQGIFNMYVVNVLWTMMAGIRFTRDNDELHRLQYLLNILFENIDMIGCLFSHYPILQYIAPTYSGYHGFMHIHKLMHAWIGREIENHKLQFNQCDPDQPRDLIDVYLRVLQDPNKSDSFTEKQLIAICLDLFIAGSETTSKTLNFAFLYMVNNVRIQERAQEEIDRVVGRNRLPNLNDRINMPYCEAIVLEGLRFFIGNSFGVPHRALSNTKLSDYDIPKDTMILASFYRMSFNEKTWDDPFAFKPERFIVDGKIYIPPQFIPFGGGRHRCMGEMMAQRSIFVFITSLLQNFKFLIPKGYPAPSLEPIDGATPNIRQHKCLIETR